MPDFTHIEAGRNGDYIFYADFIGVPDVCPNCGGTANHFSMMALDAPAKNVCDTCKTVLSEAAIYLEAQSNDSP